MCEQEIADVALSLLHFAANSNSINILAANSIKLHTDSPTDDTRGSNFLGEISPKKLLRVALEDFRVRASGNQHTSIFTS